MILTPLDRSWFSISKKVWNSKIQQSHQKLWLSKVRSASINASFRFSWYLGCSSSNFKPMNSRWNENSIIFTMALVSTRSGSRIKIRVFGPTRDWLHVKLGQSLLKISEKLRFEVKLWKMLFCESSDHVWPFIELRAN